MCLNLNILIITLNLNSRQNTTQLTYSFISLSGIIIKYVKQSGSSLPEFSFDHCCFVLNSNVIITNINKLHLKHKYIPLAILLNHNYELTFHKVINDCLKHFPSLTNLLIGRLYVHTSHWKEQILKMYREIATRDVWSNRPGQTGAITCITVTYKHFDS